MAVVARLLPRHWDGRRLLRFLTGLALLALAFTGRIDAHAAPAPADVTHALPAMHAAQDRAGRGVDGAGIRPASAETVRAAADEDAATVRAATDESVAAGRAATDESVAAGRAATDESVAAGRAATDESAAAGQAAVAQGVTARPGPAARAGSVADGAPHFAGTTPNTSGPRAPPTV
ncbi:hypothetical protein [Krasilnikovia sp. MM14-A1004]|uniref:hypothetical protein n=1 Tax=Krasilnikovia sp. MM14-A1004 TaxID=3373541 RepID=UPI00399C67EC